MYVLVVAVLEVLDAGASQCGGSSVGSAVEVEVDGAKIILYYNYNKECICATCCVICTDDVTCEHVK